MSSPDTPSRDLPYEWREGFCSLSRVPARIFQARTVGEVQHCLEQCRTEGNQAVIRGAGQSYGDAALLAERVSLELSGFDEISPVDKATGTITVGANATIHQLCEAVIGQGFWPTVVPGNANVTVGGCIAANVHGKNNFKVGAFSESVEEIKVVTGAGEVLILKTGDEHFLDFFGTFGLFGIVTSARLKLQSVASPYMDVKSVRFHTIRELLETMASYESNTDSMVAWMDGFTNGHGILELANYSTRSDTNHFERPVISKPIPRLLKLTKVSPLKVRLANKGRLITTKSSSVTHLFNYNFPLSRVQGWQTLYRPGGLVQFQCCLPRSSALSGFTEIWSASRHSIPTYLAVIKRHRPDLSPLRTLEDGYSIAMDFHATEKNFKKLSDLYQLLAEITLNHEGKFYLAKDELLTSGDFHRSHPTETFQHLSELKALHDPNFVLNSRLNDRLNLVPTSPVLP